MIHIATKVFSVKFSFIFVLKLFKSFVLKSIHILRIIIMCDILNVLCLIETAFCFYKQVQTMKMHLFTLIQLVCLCFLWLIKSSSISLTLPFFLILMVPLRANFTYLFSPQELRAVSSFHFMLIKFKISFHSFKRLQIHISMHLK